MDNFKTLYEACLNLIESWQKENDTEKACFFYRWRVILRFYNKSIIILKVCTVW